MAQWIDRGSGYARTKLNAIAFYAGAVGYTGARGTAALPVFAFEEDPDTGIYSAAANQLSLTAGGTEVQRYALVTGDTALYPQSALRVYLLGGASGTDATAITPAATTSASVVSQTFTVTGLDTTDTILAVNPPANHSGTTWFIASAMVSAPNTLRIAFGSITGTPTPPASIASGKPWRVAAVRTSA